jgi:hypothetical protein
MRVFLIVIEDYQRCGELGRKRLSWIMTDKKIPSPQWGEG